MSLGVDVSSYQGNIDFDVLKSEVAFVIAKATEGTGYKDPTFERNWTEAGRVGLIRGAYHFARPDLGNSAQDEARWFLANVGVLDPPDIIWLDYEVQWDGDVVGWCKAWLDFVRASTGIAPHIYLSLYEASVYEWPSVIDAGYPLALADYDGIPDRVPWTVWPRVAMKQWTSGGHLNGIPSVRVDLDTAFGGSMTDDELRAAIKRIYAGPDSLEEWVKADVRVMVQQDPETRQAIASVASGVVPPVPPVDVGAVVRAVGQKLVQ